MTEESEVLLQDDLALGSDFVESQNIVSIAETTVLSQASVSFAETTDLSQASVSIAEATDLSQASVSIAETPVLSQASVSISEATDLSQASVIIHDEELFITRQEIIYKLSEFEGPLDLLVTLIKNAKIKIEDIFISDVTHQYVEIIKNTPTEELDFEYAGEFILLAAELVYLKSLRALPQDVEIFDEEDPEIMRNALINKIKEYSLLQEKSLKLKAIETINRFYRAPVYTEKDFRVSLINFSMPKLVEAFAKVLLNADRHGHDIIPKKVVKDKFSVHEQMEHIRQLIVLYKEMTFRSLFQPDYDKSDIVTTFLAVLELLKYGILRVNQEEIFGEIRIFAVEEEVVEPLVILEGENGKY